ncbi:MAG: hypothetical protein V1708_03015 [Candidatus Micrarchaeota archaeon]
MPRALKGGATPVLRQLQSFVEESIGENGLMVFNSVGDGATDETIETKTSLKLSEIRSLLNHLHSYGFVEYTREKNMQNGWFTYTWKLNCDRAMQNFMQIKKRECEKLKSQLASEGGCIFYKCRKGCSRLAFESAFEQKFRCNDCKTELKCFDNGSEMKRIEQQLSIVEKMIERRTMLGREMA